MKCRQCGSKISEDFVACPYCGLRLGNTDLQSMSLNLQQPASSSSNNNGVKVALKQLINEFGVDILKDGKKLISLLSDYIPEYEKERRLIKTVINNDVFQTLLEGSADPQLAINKSREYMIKELFISENASEFILECFTYALDWEYTPVFNYGNSYGYKEEPAAKASTPAAVPAVAAAPKAAPAMPKKKMGKRGQSSAVLDENGNLQPKDFTSFDALKYRFRGKANIPYGFTAIESFAFDSYKWLRVVKLPESVSVIGEYSFSECKRLKLVTLPESVTTIKKSAFSSCERLISVNMPYGITSIEDSAFQFCSKLHSLEFPNTLSNIGSEAFSSCENLTRLRIPDSVKFIGDRAFEYCPNLTIECVNGSYVHKYCRSNQLNFTTYEPND